MCTVVVLRGNGSWQLAMGGEVEDVVVYLRTAHGMV